MTPTPGGSPTKGEEARPPLDLERAASVCTVCTVEEQPPKKAIERHDTPVWWRGSQERRTMQHQLAAFLESKTCHIVVVCLVLLDLAIVMTELVLSGFFPTEESWTHPAHTAETVLSWTSIGILCVFALEMLLRLVVFGPRYFMRVWTALDAAIVIVSLVLELVLKGMQRETLSLLVIFRLWRIVRIMHSLAESLEVKHEAALHRHHEELEEVYAQRDEARAEAGALRKRVAALEGGAGAQAAAAG